MNKDFIELSHELGVNPNYVQAAGGNTSIKDNNIMHIKASGKWLANSKKEDIFVPVDLEKIREHIKNCSSDLLEGVTIIDGSLRPSIETTLHALMPHKVVLHIHPVDLLSWLVCSNAKDKLMSLLKDFSCVWVPYARPGIELTQAVQDALRGRDVDVILLGSHGLVVGGESCAAAHDLLTKVLENFTAEIKPVDRKTDSNFNELVNSLKMRLPKYSEIHALALDELLFGHCISGTGVLYPDQAVFLGPTIPCYEGALGSDAFKYFLDRYKKSPFLVIKGHGILVAQDAKIEVDEMLRCHVRVLSRIPSECDLDYLTESEISRLLNWEPEKYRLSLED